MTCESLFFTFICPPPSTPLALNTIYAYYFKMCICRPDYPSNLLDIATWISYKHLKLKLSKSGHLSNPTSSRKRKKKYALPCDCLISIQTPCPSECPSLKTAISFFSSPSTFSALIHHQILSVLHKNLLLILPLSNSPLLLT